MNENEFMSLDEPAGTLTQRPRVLVVDDDMFIRRINCEILLSAGYGVDVAEDGAEAWDALQLASYDLLVTDNQMPKVSGVELVQKIRDARMDLPIIMATGTLPGAGLNQNPAQRAVVTLLKPYTHAELLGTVKAVMEATLHDDAPVMLVPNWECQPQTFGLRLT